MLLQHIKKLATVLPTIPVEDDPGRVDSIPTETSTFEDLLVKVAHTYPDLILLAMEIKDITSTGRK